MTMTILSSQSKGNNNKIESKEKQKEGRWLSLLHQNMMTKLLPPRVGLELGYVGSLLIEGKISLRTRPRARLRHNFEPVPLSLKS